MQEYILARAQSIVEGHAGDRRLQEEIIRKKQITKKRIAEFIAALKARGGSSGNRALRTALQWDEEFYWKVQGRLIKDQLVDVGRGMGGSVKLIPVEAELPAPANGNGTAPANKAEKKYYEPLANSLRNTWIQSFSLDEAMVEETHSRGSKKTGGTFSRPDITAIGIRTYLYLTKRLEVITFEVKTPQAVDIMGVLEAIAHREASHRSYVIYAISRQAFDQSDEVERIMELAQKFGIGVLLTEKPEDVDSWDLVIEAIRHEPDPGRLDRFLGDLPKQQMKDQLSKWKG